MGSEVSFLGLRLHFGNQWSGQWLLLVLLCTPHWILYGVFFPMANAIKMKLFKGGDVMCLYNEPMWAIADMGLFFCMWALLLFMCHLVRHVRDQLGEYLAIRRALFLSLGSLAFTIIAEILQIDGLCLGRSIITASVMVSTTSFFVLQNYDAL